MNQEKNSPDDLDRCLQPTETIDSDHPDVVEYARNGVEGVGDDPVDVAVALYYKVRDGILYDPYLPFHRPECFRASHVLESGRGFCIGKASLLCAAARARGVPTRVGFATVKNHLASPQLLEFLGSDLFVYHAFVEFHLNGDWVKATPAFNKSLCALHNVDPLEFDGREDSLFHAFNREKKQFMEYVARHGSYTDIPVDAIVAEFEKTYGKDRVRGWMETYDASARA